VLASMHKRILLGKRERERERGGEVGGIRFQDECENKAKILKRRAEKQGHKKIKPGALNVPSLGKEMQAKARAIWLHLSRLFRGRRAVTVWPLGCRVHQNRFLICR